MNGSYHSIGVAPSVVDLKYKQWETAMLKDKKVAIEPKVVSCDGCFDPDCKDCLDKRDVLFS